MFERLERSWELVKASANILKQDKELLLFPVMSVAASIALTVGFGAAAYAAGAFNQDSWIMRDSDVARAVGTGYAGLYYLMLYTVIFFFNSALVGAALVRLRGGDPTLGTGFQIASQRFGAIFGYALLSATVGLILGVISRRGGFIGRFIARLLGAAWNVTTFLSVPALVTEDIGPIAAIKRSAELLKKTWGEQLVASFGINIVFNWLIFFSILVFAGGAYVTVGVMEAPVALLPLSGLLMTWVTGLLLLRAALGGIYSAVLYHYALGGAPSASFDPEVIRGAFQLQRA